jgi:DNA-binding NtrC family response regulator
LVVKDDVWQRELVATLLEETGMGVIQRESAEAAMRVLCKMAGDLSLMFTDVNLAGRIDGVELAHFAMECYPNIHVIVTSGRALTESLPEGAMFMPKPWLPLDVLNEAERSRHKAALVCSGIHDICLLLACPQ